MPELSQPSAVFRTSFLAAMTEFVAEGRGGPTDRSMVGDEINWLRDRGWSDAAAFDAFVRRLCDQAVPNVARARGRVPATTFWWTDGTDYLGRIAIRHHLTPQLHEWGGHIGYDVRPTARRRGHATAMLATALPVAHQLGIDRALITCDRDNAASRAVIERNGGVFEDERGGKLRFWVPTAGHTASALAG